MNINDKLRTYMYIYWIVFFIAIYICHKFNIYEVDNFTMFTVIVCLIVLKK